MDAADSFSNDFDQHPLLPAAIKLAVEDLLPRTEIQFAIRDRHDDLPAHNLPFDVSIRVVFAGVVMPVLIDGFVRHQPLEEIVVVLKQSCLVVVDVNAGADMHGVYQAQAFSDAALLQCGVHLGRDVDVCASGLRLEGEFFTVGFHNRFPVVSVPVLLCHIAAKCMRTPKSNIPPAQNGRSDL
jgi:hypothetical protein